MLNKFHFQSQYQLSQSSIKSLDINFLFQFQSIVAILMLAVAAQALPIELGHYAAPALVHAAPALLHAPIHKAIVAEPVVSSPWIELFNTGFLLRY